MTRVLLVGSPAQRAELRARLNTSAQVAGEFATLAAARRSGIDVDAVIVSPAHEEPRTASTPRALAETLDEPLTPREVEVLELLAEGLPNKAIAGRLGISDQTVKFHVASISAKLGATNRTDAVRRAARRGLIAL